MWILDARQQVGAAAGLRNRRGESASASLKRIPGRGEPHPPHLPSRLRLSDPERSTLAEIGKRSAEKICKLVASVALPDTILAWYCRLIKHPGKELTSSRLNWVDCVNKGSKSVLIHADISA